MLQNIARVQQINSSASKAHTFIPVESVYKAILSGFPKYTYIKPMQQFLIFLANCCWGFHGNQAHSLKAESSGTFRLYENAGICCIGVSE